MIEDVEVGDVIVVLHDLASVRTWRSSHLLVVPDQIHNVEHCGRHPPPPLVVELFESLAMS